MSIARRLAAFVRALADRIAPPEPEPEVMSYADFCQRLKDERERELPNDGQIVEVRCKYGKRTARYDRWNYCFWFTDCTHPMQNAFLAVSDVSSWSPHELRLVK